MEYWQTYRSDRYSYWNHSNSPQLASVDPYPYSFLIVLGSNKKCQSVANFRIAPCCLPNPIPIQWKIFKNTANFGPNTRTNSQPHPILGILGDDFTGFFNAYHGIWKQSPARGDFQNRKSINPSCSDAMMQCQKLAPSPQKEQPTMWRCRWVTLVLVSATTC